MPAQIGTRYFDPKRRPRDMPPLTGPEEAVCASDFLSDASVGAQAMQTDATHAKATETETHPAQAGMVPALTAPSRAESDKRAVPRF